MGAGVEGSEPDGKAADKWWVGAGVEVALELGVEVGVVVAEVVGEKVRTGVEVGVAEEVEEGVKVGVAEGVWVAVKIGEDVDVVEGVDVPAVGDERAYFFVSESERSGVAVGEAVSSPDNASTAVGAEGLGPIVWQPKTVKMINTKHKKSPFISMFLSMFPPLRRNASVGFVFIFVLGRRCPCLQHYLSGFSVIVKVTHQRITL